MLRKLPIVGPSYSTRDLFSGLARRDYRALSGEFTGFLSAFTKRSNIFLTNSGISAFYLILEALNKQSLRTEVILPAYTAGSLIVAVKKAGLKPMLCDISLDDFNLERNALLKTISQDTLAVVAVHLFGIAMQDMQELRRNIPQDVFLIEDCAQAMGSAVGSLPAGSLADASFFSFNRGKNLALCGGGCIATNQAELAQTISAWLADFKGDVAFVETTLFLRALAFSCAVNPYIYALGFPLLKLFKDTQPPRDFSVDKMPGFLVALGVVLEEKINLLFAKRRENGIYLMRALKGAPGIILPKVPENAPPVFNRFPLLFEDIKQKELIAEQLWKNGVETSEMYLQPLHWMFELGYEKQAFPNAIYFAEHLLTLPIHPGVQEEDLVKMTEIIKTGDVSRFL